MSTILIPAQDCASLFGIYEVPASKGAPWTVTLEGEQRAECNCPAYRFYFSRHPEAEEWDRTCKHLALVYDGACKYNIQWSGGSEHPAVRPARYTAPLVPGAACPACGGPMVAVRRAV